MCEIFDHSGTLLVCLEELHHAPLWKYTWYWVKSLKSDYLPSPGGEVRQFSDTGLNLGSLPLFFTDFYLPVWDWRDVCSDWKACQPKPLCIFCFFPPFISLLQHLPSSLTLTVSEVTLAGFTLHGVGNLDVKSFSYQAHSSDLLMWMCEQEKKVSK